MRRYFLQQTAGKWSTSKSLTKMEPTHKAQGADDSVSFFTLEVRHHPPHPIQWLWLAYTWREKRTLLKVACGHFKSATKISCFLSWEFVCLSFPNHLKFRVNVVSYRVRNHWKCSLGNPAFLCSSLTGIGLWRVFGYACLFFQQKQSV